MSSQTPRARPIAALEALSAAASTGPASRNSADSGPGGRVEGDRRAADGAGAGGVGASWSSRALRTGPRHQGRRLRVGGRRHRPRRRHRAIPQHVAEPHWTSPPALAAVPALAACPNGSGSLFTGAKLGHLSLRPHGRQERERRAQSIGAQANEEFGYCTLFGECTQVCPAGIPITAVAALNHERLRTWARRFQVRDNARRSECEHPRRGDE